MKGIEVCLQRPKFTETFYFLLPTSSLPWRKEDQGENRKNYALKTRERQKGFAALILQVYISKRGSSRSFLEDKKEIDFDSSSLNTIYVNKFRNLRE